MNVNCYTLSRSKTLITAQPFSARKTATWKGCARLTSSRFRGKGQFCDKYLLCCGENCWRSRSHRRASVPWKWALGSLLLRAPLPPASAAPSDRYHISEMRRPSVPQIQKTIWLTRNLRTTESGGGGGGGGSERRRGAGAPPPWPQLDADRKPHGLQININANENQYSALYGSRTAY